MWKDSIHFLRRFRINEATGLDYAENTSNLPTRLLDVFWRTADLGFTSFGGPNVHFQIFHRRFVDQQVGKRPLWIDEQTYKEIFVLTQALPGPASTKMLFCIAQIHAGIVPAVFTFLLWSLPAASVMYALTFGVTRVGETLPGPAYAFLSGLNSATVGLIALSAVQLARKAINDKTSRILVLSSACAGICYNALWYFPVLLVMGGFAMFAWEIYGEPFFKRLRSRQRRRSSSNANESRDNGIVMVDRGTDENICGTEGLRRRAATPVQRKDTEDRKDSPTHQVSVKMGVALIVLFFVTFAVFMSLRGGLHPSPLLLSLFNNMFLAGTIIFGGGPVVIPLLRNYVVDPGWVSPRDFLLGLAIIQAMPGPNFNFAVYLGALTVASNSDVPSIVGAILGYLGIFVPGFWLCVGFQSIWHSLRERREVGSILRGMNATAVGFIFTAVYRLWEIGYLTPDQAQGISLASEPWWLVIATITYAAVEWFFVPPPVAILSGGILGLGWYGVAGRHIYLSVMNS